MNGFIKEINYNELQPGMVTGTTVKTPTGQVLFSPGTVLTQAYITRIKLYKISSVSVFFPKAVSNETQAPKPVFKNTENKKQTTLIKQTDHIVAPSRTGGAANPTYSQQVKRSDVFLSFETSFAISIGEITHYFGEVCEERIGINCQTITEAINHLASICRTSVDLFDMLHNMRQNNDSIYAHCLNVSLIARQMGIWLKLPKADIDLLAIAGLFHDIGKLKLPKELLEKKERLTDEEFNLIHRHPQYGYNILKHQEIDSRIKQATLQHHERCDGSGYPLGLMGDDLNDFAMILAIADVYDAMTAARAYRSPLCPFQVIAEFEKDGLQKYKPQFILTFLNQIAKTYQNNRVILNNGVSANIVLLNNSHLSKPVVQLNDGSCIDLSTSDLYIKALI